MMATRTAATAAMALVVLLSGCSDDGSLDGLSGAEQIGEVGEVTLQSDQSTATVGPLCVDDIPEDLTTCADAPANLGQVELDQTRKATLVVPDDVATSGYRVRINGRTPTDLTGVIEERQLVLRISPEAVRAPGDTVLTVETLSGREHPKAVWQFLLSDPAGTAG